MAAKAKTLHNAIVELGEAIDSLDADDRRTLTAVRRRYKVVVRTATVAERHAGNLTSVMGFDCSPPDHFPRPQ